MTEKLKKIQYSCILLSIITTITTIFFQIYNKLPIVKDEISYKLIGEWNNSINLYNINTGSLLAFGLLNAIIIWTISIVRIKTNKENKIELSSIFFLISPAFIYAILNPGTELIAITLAITIVYAADKEMWKIVYLLAIGAGFLRIDLAILLTIIIIAIIITKKEKKQMQTAFIITVLTAITKSALIKETLTITLKNIPNTINSTIFEFGNPSGITILFIIIAIVSIIAFWMKKSKEEALILILAITSLILNDKLFFMFSIVVIAGKLINTLYIDKWEIHALKTISITLLSIIIIFHIFSFLNIYTNHNISNTEINIAKDIIKLDLNNILTNSNNGYYIEQVTNKNTFAKIDNKMSTNMANQIFYSTNLKRTIELIKENEIETIIITEKMKKEIWNNNKKGLLIMIEDPKFTKIKSTNKYSIYQIN